MTHPSVTISGFLKKPRRTSHGVTYGGRFSCHEVQWTGEGSNALATFTITAQELADAAEGHLLWTDQDVQRGIVPGLQTSPLRILPLADGYPNRQLYIFDATKADNITEKLLSDERLFLGPLVWNLRPGMFEAYWDSASSKIYIYHGNIYLPDSHHRQQAILKAVRTWRESPESYPKFSPDKQFKVELYFLSKEDEGNYFFDKNQLPKPTAKSKAYDLTTLDDLSLLAKNVITKSSALKENVNRVTDRLMPRNPQVITLSTLREMMKAFAPSDQLDLSEMEGLATVAATFYDLLAEIRPELGVLPASDRRVVRESLIVDAAVMMHGYAVLMSDFNNSIAPKGLKGAIPDWKTRLMRFSDDRRYHFEKWSGDIFAKANPLWSRIGVVKPGKDGRRLTVLNTGGARSECGRVLRQLVSLNRPTTDLQFLSMR